jgi:hypothetical protein
METINNENNLIYVFLDKNFTDSKVKEDTKWAYDILPQYYTDTFNFNKLKFKQATLLTNTTNILNSITTDNDFKKIDTIIDNKWSRYKQNPFWYNTFIRVILLCLYIRNNDLKNTIHIEADNIIFEPNIDILSDFFKPGEFGFCNESPFSSAPCFIFIKDKQAADTLLNLHIKLLEKGEQELSLHCGHFGSYITDMAFLDLIFRRGKEYKMLPCLPYGPFSQNFDKLQCVFDPTSYGQYIGGTNQQHPPGYMENYHFIGHELIHKNIKVIFDKRPYIIYNDNKIPIFNLHVHNKKAINKILQDANS